jgi:hypothetical protein
MSKPKCKLIGTDGNTLALLGQCTKALKKAGLTKEASELTNKIFKCDSYDKALQTMMEYVEVE